MHCALLSELGIVAGNGKAGLARPFDELRAGTLERPPDAVIAAKALADQRAALDAAADALERRITAQAKADKKASLPQTAPGVGPLSAHAVLATMPDPSLFRSGRDFAAWLGLTPRLDGTGGKIRTGHITKQGNQPLPRLLVLGAPRRCASARLALRRPRRGPRRSWPSPRRRAPLASCGPCSPTISPLAHRPSADAPTLSQGAQQQLMAKSVGIPDRDHSVLSSRVTARQDGGRARPRIPSRPAAHDTPHQQAGHMTALLLRPSLLLNNLLRTGGRPHMTTEQMAKVPSSRYLRR
jgi:hypothetical protein